MQSAGEVGLMPQPWARPSFDQTTHHPTYWLIITVPLVPSPLLTNTLMLCETQVEVDLTREGLANRYKVLSALFSYLALIRKQGIPSYLASELRDLADIGWRFQVCICPACPMGCDLRVDAITIAV